MIDKIPNVLEVNWLSISAATIIAIYAMVGGALIGAAITAPQNCKIVLHRIIRPIVTVLVALCFIGAGAGMFAGLTSPVAVAILKLSDWITVGTIMVAGIYLMCKRIVLILTGES